MYGQLEGAHTDPSLDAVVIGTWPYMHRTLVLAALEAGKHVLTEARLVSQRHTACISQAGQNQRHVGSRHVRALQAANAAEAKEMYQASLRRPLQVAQVVPSPITFKYDETIQDIIKRGVLGELVYVEVMP